MATVFMEYSAMKTTFELLDVMFRQAKVLAAARGVSVSSSKR